MLRGLSAMDHPTPPRSHISPLLPGLDSPELAEFLSDHLIRLDPLSGADVAGEGDWTEGGRMRWTWCNGA